jgi:hypothetical protein
MRRTQNRFDSVHFTEIRTVNRGEANEDTSEHASLTALADGCGLSQG